MKWSAKVTCFVLFLACFATSVAFGAAAPAPTPAMMAPIKRIATFVNTGSAIPVGTYATAATITDEFAPFHWKTGDVGRQWSDGFTAYNAASKITKPRFVLGTPTEFASSAARAYIVLPGTFTPLLNGKPFTETGFWTFVVVREGSVWRVLSQAWAGVTFK
ncbi:MAG TPA: hypothetical protein VID19_11300 [Candidatus Eremiobacteraceae bacterium]